jgi:thioredoxin reductase (NADPH)
VIIAPPPAWAWTYTEAAALAGIAGDITVLDKPPSAPSAGVTVVNGHIVALEGNDGLEAVTIEAGGQRNTVPANAVFVYTGRAPAAEFMPDSLARDASRHIVVDEQGQTSLPLVYAAGDVRSGTKDYLRNAIADGQNVARSVVAALAK